MRWGEELTLIALTTPAEPNNANGFPNPPIETATTVFANKKSIGRYEFYKGEMSGMNPRFSFDVYTEEFDGQNLAEYDGKRYHVLRSFTNKTGELTEIVLSELPRGGGRNDG